MAGELNTQVDSDPASCRATADWLGTLSAKVYEAETAIRNAGVASVACWEGPAGDAFRGATGPMADDAGELSRVTDRIRTALTTFADEIHTVISRMTQARDVAAASGLIVTPAAILPPGPAPAPAPAPTPGTYGPTLGEAAAHAYAQKVAAWNEVTVTVAEARLKEAAAHEALDAAMGEGTTTASALKTIGQNAIIAGLATVQGLREEADDLLRNADRIRDHGERMQELASESTATQSMRAVAARAGDLAMDGRALTTAEADRLLRPIGFIPEGGQRFIATSAGTAIPDGRSWTGLARGAARGVPLVGTAATVGFAAVDLAQGKPVDQVAAETAAGAGGGMVGAMAGGAIGTAVCPVVGTVIGGVIGGIIGSVAATDGVTQAYEDD